MQVIVCGCSWANGAELAPSERPFGHVISDVLGADCLHMAQDAASIPHMVLQLQRAINQIRVNERVIALFLLTAPDRDLMWSHTRPIGTGHMRENPPPYAQAQPIFLNGNDPLHRDWFAEYHSPELAQYRANTSIITLQALCRYHGIQDYYAWAFDRVSTWPEVCLEKFWKQGSAVMQDSEFATARTKYTIKHPDQAQHELLAARFLHMIQNS